MNMNTITFSLALCAAFIASVLAAAIPPCPESSISDVDASTPQFQQVMGNLSYLFGWTMAGAAVNEDELDAGCEDIGSFGHGKWAAEGLIPAYIQAPICNSSHGDPNPTASLPYMLQYSTGLFITQLLSAFAPDNANASYTHLCQTLSFTSLDGFNLQDARVINATCAAAGLQLPPRIEGVLPGELVAPNITAAYWNTISMLYALLFASGAESDSQLNIDCAHAGNHVMSLNLMKLNGTLVKNTICDAAATNTPLSVEQAGKALQTWSSRAFITVIENISTASGWLKWLIVNLDVDAMNAVGLDGQAVLSQLQKDGSSSS